MKTRGDFHFKKFSMSHDRSTHKVGTDGVLLGAWANVSRAKNILDIGTGSGLIALMLAQRSQHDASIDAVELQESDAKQAQENFQRSPWPEKISAHHAAIQEFLSEKKYDLIVSNPPFFINSWLPPDEKRSKARHSNELTFRELLSAVVRLLSPTGRFAVVLPVTEGNQFIDLAQATKLNVIRKLLFRSRKDKPVERLFVEFSYETDGVTTEELVLYIQNENWTDEYRSLTRDFYLKA
jgi:tRNA1Val (adenine37-N6)-methyltransferase